jgi:hypothetical protein
MPRSAASRHGKQSLELLAHRRPGVDLERTADLRVGHLRQQEGLSIVDLLDCPMTHDAQKTLLQLGNVGLIINFNNLVDVRLPPRKIVLPAVWLLNRWRMTF